MATFQFEIPETGNISTYAGRFSNGCLNSDVTDVRFGVLESDKADVKGRKRSMLVAETPSMTYIGHSSGMYAPAANKHCKYMVGVLNRKKGKMRLFDTRLFNLRPAALVEEKDDAEEEKEEQEKEKTNRNMLDDLTSAFGSRRKKQAMTSRLKNQLKDDVLQAAVSTAVQHTNVDVAAFEKTLAESQEAASGIPPYDKEATRPHDVYKLTDLISEEAMQALQVAAKELADCNAQTLATMKEEHKYPEYILHHLSILPIREEARVEKCCCLLYLYYMIILFNMKVRGLKPKNPLEEYKVPNLVEKQLLMKFTLTAGGKRVMPARLKDTLVSYILALCLHLDEFEFSTYHMQKDLKLGINKIRMFLQALGCSCKIQTVQDPETGLAGKCCVATLPLPLKFPDPSKRKGKGKGQG